MYEKLRKKADALYTDRIGDDCFCDAISVALEFKNCLYWAFDYVDYKFFTTLICLHRSIMRIT